MPTAPLLPPDCAHQCRSCIVSHTLTNSCMCRTSFCSGGAIGVRQSHIACSCHSTGSWAMPGAPVSFRATYAMRTSHTYTSTR